jgi:drug/metabolite transporter (DMT)-like permease
MKENSVRAWVIFIALVAVWGSSFLLMKKGITVFAPEQVGAIRIVYAMLFSLGVGSRFLKQFPPQKEWGAYLAVGLLGNGIPYILFPIAVSHIPSGLVGITNSLTPLFTLVFGLLFFGRTMRRKQALGVAVGFAGAALLVGGQANAAQAEPGAWMYVLLAAGSSMCYGMSINFIGFRLSHSHPIALTLWAFVLAGIPAAAFLFSSDFVVRATSHPDGLEVLGYLAFLGIVGTAAAIMAFNYLISITSPLFAASTTYLVPGVALLWGLSMGEALHMHHAVGLLTILFGVYLVNSKQRT